jgi:putative Holliday junction resolvase
MNDEVVLGFDFGARRIGVAIGNTLTREARPLAIVAAEGEARWVRIAALIAEWQPARLVVGIPRHPDGAAHEMTQRCERFARRLEGRHRLPVARVDERYSSVEADAQRASRRFPSPSGGGGRGEGGVPPRGDNDAEAAAVILQQYLDQR